MTKAVYNDVSKLVKDNQTQSRLQLFFSGKYDANAINPKNNVIFSQLTKLLLT